MLLPLHELSIYNSHCVEAMLSLSNNCTQAPVPTTKIVCRWGCNYLAFSLWCRHLKCKELCIRNANCVLSVHLKDKYIVNNIFSVVICKVFISFFLKIDRKYITKFFHLRLQWRVHNTRRKLDFHSFCPWPSGAFNLKKKKIPNRIINEYSNNILFVYFI